MTHADDDLAPWQRLGPKFRLGLRARSEQEWLSHADAFGHADRRAVQVAEANHLLDTRHADVFAALDDALDDCSGHNRDGEDALADSRGRQAAGRGHPLASAIAGLPGETGPRSALALQGLGDGPALVPVRALRPAAALSPRWAVARCRCSSRCSSSSRSRSRCPHPLARPPMAATPGLLSTRTPRAQQAAVIVSGCCTPPQPKVQI